MKKMSKAQKIKNAYLKEWNKVKARFRRAKKEGYDINIKEPSKVKRPTEASIRRLKKQYSQDKINRSASRVDTETGEIVSRRTEQLRRRWEAHPKKPKQLKIKIKPEKSTEYPTSITLIDGRTVPIVTEPVDDTQMIIDAFLADVRSLTRTPRGEKRYMKIANFIHQLVRQYGDRAVAKAIDEGEKVTCPILYDDDYAGEIWMNEIQTLASKFGENDPLADDKQVQIESLNELEETLAEEDGWMPVPENSAIPFIS